MELVKVTFGLEWAGHSSGARLVARALWRFPLRAGGYGLGEAVAYKSDGKSTPSLDAFLIGAQPLGTACPEDLSATLFQGYAADTAENITAWKRAVKALRRETTTRAEASSRRRVRFEATLRAIGGGYPLPWDRRGWL